MPFIYGYKKDYEKKNYGEHVDDFHNINLELRNHGVVLDENYWEEDQPNSRRASSRIIFARYSPLVQAGLSAVEFFGEGVAELNLSVKVFDKIQKCPSEIEDIAEHYGFKFTGKSEHTADRR